MAAAEGQDDGWVYPVGNRCQPTMVEFMSFFHGAVDYEADAVFTREQMLEITPVDVKRCLCLKARNDPYPSDDATPRFARSDSLFYAKKALSYCMVYRTVAWCQGRGNPTKSALVNDMIKKVKKSEVRGQGAPSNAKRALSQEEFRKTLDLFRAQNDFNHRFKCSMMALWQFALIGRVDDVSNFKTADPQGHGDFDFALKTKVRWSKNVLEERQCPPQTLLGAMDAMFCVLLNLGLCLEQHLGFFPNAQHLFTESDSNNAVKNLIATCRNRLDRVVFKNRDFRALGEGNHTVGTHSLRKCPSNYARGCGCAPDEIEIRGRWKSSGQRVVFRCIDVRQLTIDAKVAGVLSLGGPIKCKLKEGASLSDEWMFANVCPNIHRKCPNDTRLCRMLGTALLFAAMDPELGESLVPAPMRNRITQAHMPTHPTIAQPVKRVPVTVCRIQDTLMIDEVPQANDDAPFNVDGQLNGARNENNNLPIQRRAIGNFREEAAQLLINIQRLQQQQAQNHQQPQDSISAPRNWSANQFRAVNANVRAFGGAIQSAVSRQDPQQAARRRQATDPERQVEEGTFPATLSKTPKTLAELWEECQFGVGGRKPAKDFSATERGNTRNGIKQKHCRRKFAWLAIEKLIERGYSLHAAINRIRSSCGYRCSVTQIINFIAAQHKNGGTGHPNLVNLRPYLRGGGGRVAVVADV